MATRRGIVTGGTWCVDYNRIVDFWPEEDGITRLVGEERHGGGSGFNLAVDIRHLDPDLPVETIAVVGDDDDGRYLEAFADRMGIRRDQMRRRSGAPTQFTDAFVSLKSRRRTHIYCSGVADQLTPDDFDLEATTGRLFHLGLPGVHARMDGPWQGDACGWATVLRKARAAGLLTNIELCSIEEERLVALVLPCLPLLDHVIVNDREIAALSGVETRPGGATDPAACERAARAVLERGAMRVVVVHWPDMALAVTREGGAIRRPSIALPADEIRGANGAGDAFAAGMLYGIHESWPLDDALALAHASAAASMRAVTTTDAVPGWREALRLAALWGWRDRPAA